MQATTTDLTQIITLKLAMFEAAGVANLLADNAASIILDDYLKMYAEGTATHFIAREGDEIIAIAGAFIKNDLPYRYFKNPVYGFIGDVYTQPDYRRRGLATSLTHRVLDWFRGQGITQVRLLASEEAAPIYKELGFRYNDEMVLELNP